MEITSIDMCANILAKKVEMWKFEYSKAVFSNELEFGWTVK